MKKCIKSTFGTLAGSLFFMAAANAQQASTLSDAEVASIAVTANRIDINYADLAKKKSRNADVIKFAETMQRDHKAVIAQAAELVNKLGVTPQENAVGKKMLADAAKTIKTLRSKSGTGFDKAYIANEVTYHRAVIDAVTNTLIPETENAELKQLLQDVLPALKAHLAHAEMLEKNHG